MFHPRLELRVKPELFFILLKKVAPTLIVVKEDKKHH